MIKKILAFMLITLLLLCVSGCQTLGSFLKPDEFSFGGKNERGGRGIKEFNWGFKWKLN